MFTYIPMGLDVAQTVEHSAVAVWIHLHGGLILLVEAFAVCAIFYSNQWSTTGPSNAVLSVGKCIYKIPCCLLERVAYVPTAVSQ